MSAVSIDALDHLVFTVRNIQTTVNFYTHVLGMQEVHFKGRTALKFGHQKINLHPFGNEFEPKAHVPTPGSQDICLLTSAPMHEIIKHLNRLKIKIIEGPVQRTGAMGAIHSVYFRDPDNNLIELSNSMHP